MGDTNKKNKKKEYSTLLSVLANGSTDSARKLLKKHSGQDATDTKDLEVKLSRVYALSPAKYDLEKEFAEIHPHKDFILKYTKPVIIEKPLQPLQAEVENKPNDPNIKSEMFLHEGYCDFAGHPPCGDPNCPYCNRYLNMNGNVGCRNQGKQGLGLGLGRGRGFGQGCPCRQASNCCGNDNYSNAEGERSRGTQLNQSIVVLGVIGIVALYGMVLYLKTKRE